MIFITGLFADFLGVSQHCQGNNCIVAASSTIPNIIFAIFILLFVAFYPQLPIQTDVISKFGTLHKIISFFIDFLVAMLIISPFSGLPLLLSEFNHTGSFTWAFQRDFSRSTDSIYIALSILSVLILIVYYFYKHKKLKRPTIGQYLLSGIK